jgi:hypothetical protein
MWDVPVRDHGADRAGQSTTETLRGIVAGVSTLTSVPLAIEWAVALFFVVTWLLQLAVAVIFTPYLRSEFIETRERAWGSLRDLYVSGVVALLAARLLFDWPLPEWLGFALLVSAFLTFPLRSAIFLWLWARGKFV